VTTSTLMICVGAIPQGHKRSCGGLGKERRIEAARELVSDGAGHQHVIVALAPNEPAGLPPAG